MRTVNKEADKSTLPQTTANQNTTTPLYENLVFAKDVCRKKLVVVFESFGKNPMNKIVNDETRPIKKKLGYIPNSSVVFSYKGCKYYISIADRAYSSDFKKGDSAEISVNFYKNIPEPYKHKLPFSIITSIKSYKERSYD